MNTVGPISFDKPQIQRTSSCVGVSSILSKRKTWCTGFQNFPAAHRKCRLTSTSAIFKSLDRRPHKRSFSRSPSVSSPIHPRRTSEQCVGVTNVGKPISLPEELAQNLRIPVTKVVVHQIIHRHVRQLDMHFRADKVVHFAANIQIMESKHIPSIMIGCHRSGAVCAARARTHQPMRGRK